METVGNATLEIRRGGKTLELQAKLAGFEPSTAADDDDEKEKLKHKSKRRYQRIVRWERFLAQRTLRILVVEVDDCTRQVVSALLRNCYYQVTAVADGLQAWELLEDPSNHFDLVLTEVVMPSLSGFCLLRKIMGHKTLKNIPVIMMSSLDSIHIVFKCLSKGAVDFFVKPVRKNELQNIWQHVWRRCHSSSGSGGGSPNQAAVQTKSEAGFGNNTDNIGGNKNINGLNTGLGSDKGSGTQGSWTNRDVEIENANQRVKLDSHCYSGSTFAQVPQQNKEKIQDGWIRWIQVAETSGKQDEKSCVKANTDKELGYAIPRQVATYVECLSEQSTFHDQVHKKKEACCPVSFEEGVQLCAESVNTGGVSLTKAIDLIGTMASKSKHTHMDREEEGSCKVNLDQRMNFYHVKDTTLCNANSLLELELTLHRPQANRIESGKHEDKCMPIQSNASAFSRFNIGGTPFPLTWGGSFPGTAYPLSKKYGAPSCMSSENPVSSHFTVPFVKAGSTKGSRGDDLDHYQLSQGTNNQDRCSSVIGPSGQESLPSIRDVVGPALPVPTQMGLPMPIPHGIISCDGVPPGYGPAFPPIFYSYPGVPVWGSATTVKEERRSAHDADEHEPHILSPQALHNSHLHNQLHHHHIQYHHHHHEEHQNNQHAQQEEKTLGIPATTVPWRSSCNMPGNTSDADFGECGSNNGHGSSGNVNGSASGSHNNASNVQNGQSSIAVTPGTNGVNGTGNTVTSGTGSRDEQNRLAQREAALTKFRQKRKNRCFEKKVHYQSRKMLAEQRPRVRGQFVRRSMNESEAGGAK